MVGIKRSLTRHIELVVAHLTMTDNQTADLQIQGLVARRVLRRKRIDDVLNIKRRVGIRTIKTGLHSKHLRRRNGNSTIHGLQVIHLDRKAGGLKKGNALLVDQRHVINDQAIEQAHINTPHRDWGAQLRRKGLSQPMSNERLSHGDIYHDDNDHVQAYQSPYNRIDEMFNPFQSLCKIRKINS